MSTSKTGASKAGKLLRISKSKNVRAVAASDLAQTKRHHTRGGRRPSR